MQTLHELRNNATRLAAVGAATLLLMTAIGCSSSNKLRFTSAPPTTITAGQTYTYTAAVSGTSGLVAYTLQTSPAGMTVNGAGLVSWATTAADVGSHPVILRAVSGTRSRSQSWTIQVAQPVPQLASGNVDINAGIEPELAFHLNWRNSIESAGSVPAEALLAADPALNGVPAAYGFGWTDASGTPDLASEAFPDLNSWQNPETRAAFLAMVEQFVTLVQPQWLLLGNEIDPPLETFDAAEWDAWLDVLSEARALVAAASPATIVFTRPRAE